MSRGGEVARPSWVTSDHLDTSYSTFQLISKDTGTGTGRGRWCVCSPGDHHYTCKGCIPGASPGPGATRLHASRSCHCRNTLGEEGQVWGQDTWLQNQTPALGFQPNLAGVSSAAGSSRWSLRLLWDWAYWAWGPWERPCSLWVWDGRAGPCSALQSTDPPNVSVRKTSENSKSKAWAEP